MFGRVKRNARREAERQVDEITSATGRDTKFLLSDAERSQMMGMAMRWAMPWGIVAIIFIVGGLLYERFEEQAWPKNAWVRLLLPPIVLFAAFFYKRRQLLDKAAGIWAAKRAQVIRDTIKARRKNRDAKRQ